MDKFHVFVYMLTRDEESKTKDSVYNTHLNFRTFFNVKKVRIIHGKYGTRLSQFEVLIRGQQIKWGNAILTYQIFSIAGYQ